MITIDLFYLMEVLLPPFIRTPILISFLRAPFRVLNTVLTDFYSFYEAKKYELTFNGEVIYLEHLLNDQFDDVLRRIYIDDAEQTPSIYWFNVSEDNEETFLFNNSETSDELYLFNSATFFTDYDFIVFVPIGLVYDANLMKYYVNKYRCAGKRFKIEEI